MRPNQFYKFMNIQNIITYFFLQKYNELNYMIYIILYNYCSIEY